MIIQQLVKEFWERNAKHLDSAPSLSSKNTPTHSARSSVVSSRGSFNIESANHADSTPSGSSKSTLTNSARNSALSSRSSRAGSTATDRNLQAVRKRLAFSANEDLNDSTLMVEPLETDDNSNCTFENIEQWAGKDPANSDNTFNDDHQISNESNIDALQEITPSNSPQSTPSVVLHAKTPQKLPGTSESTTPSEFQRLEGGNQILDHYRKVHLRNNASSIQDFILSILSVLVDKNVNEQDYIFNLAVVIKNPNTYKIDLFLHLFYLEKALDETMLTDNDKKLIIAHVLYTYLKRNVRNRNADFQPLLENKDVAKILNINFYYAETIVSKEELNDDTIDFLYNIYNLHIKPYILQKENDELTLNLENLCKENIYLKQHLQHTNLIEQIAKLQDISLKNKLLKFLLERLEQLIENRANGDDRNNSNDMNENIQNQQKLEPLTENRADGGGSDNSDNMNETIQSQLSIVTAEIKLEILYANNIFIKYRPQLTKLIEQIAKLTDVVIKNKLLKLFLEKLESLQENRLDVEAIDNSDGIVENIQKELAILETELEKAQSDPVKSLDPAIITVINASEEPQIQTEIPQTITAFLRTKILDHNQKNIVSRLNVELSLQGLTEESEIPKALLKLLQDYQFAKEQLSNKNSTYDWQNDFLPKIKAYETTLTYNLTTSQKIIRGGCIVAGLLLGAVIGFAVGVTVGACIGTTVGSVCPLWGNIVGAIGGGSFGGVIAAVKAAGIGASIGAIAGMSLIGLGGATLANVAAKKSQQPDHIYLGKELAEALKKPPSISSSRPE